jgi:5'(3')-deoxyribonucleotidase
MARIAIDVDEVLVNFLYPMARSRRLGKPKKLKYNYVYREIFDITEEESQEFVKEFYKSDAFRNLKPITGSQRAMNWIRSQSSKLYVVTGRQNIVRGETEEWIHTYFPGIFDDVILTNSYTPEEIRKVDICRALNIGLIIDDNKAICDECLESGVRAINYIGEEPYPWCEESDIMLKGWRNFPYIG